MELAMSLAPADVEEPAIWAAVRSILHQADGPLTASQVLKRAGPPAATTLEQVVAWLNDQTAAGTVFQFAPYGGKSPRYWTRPMGEYARVVVLRLLAERPRSRSELAQALTAPLREMSQDRRSRLAAQLLAAGEIRELPPYAGARTKRLSVHPPDPYDYLNHALNQICEKLAPAGVTATDLWAAARDLAAAQLRLPLEPTAAVPPGGSRGAAFERPGVAVPRPAATGVAPPADDTALAGLVLQQMELVEPGAARGALVALRDLRRAAPLSSLEKPAFDRVILELSEQGRVVLHRHDYPAVLGEAERNELVADGRGNYFIGIALRR